MESIESEVAAKDPYVNQIVKRYKPFKFNLALFENDAEFAKASFKTAAILPEGPFKGSVFWGHHQSGIAKFVPYGFCIIINREKSTMLMGAFKAGKQVGDQRVMKSKPVD